MDFDFCGVKSPAGSLLRDGSWCRELLLYDLVMTSVQTVQQIFVRCGVL